MKLNHNLLNIIAKKYIPIQVWWNCGRVTVFSIKTDNSLKKVQMFHKKKFRCFSSKLKSLKAANWKHANVKLLKLSSCILHTPIECSALVSASDSSTWFCYILSCIPSICSRISWCNFYLLQGFLKMFTPRFCICQEFFFLALPAKCKCLASGSCRI